MLGIIWKEFTGKKELWGLTCARFDSRNAIMVDEESFRDPKKIYAHTHK